MEMNEERKVSLLGLADILSASIGGFSWAPLISKICKNKVEAEALFTGLSALICRGQHGSQVQHIDGIRIAGLPFDGARESSLSGSSTFTSDSYENKLSSVNSTKDRSSGEYTYSERTDVSDMQVKSVSSSDIRISVSSALSTSSHQASSSGRSLSYFSAQYLARLAKMEVEYRRIQIIEIGLPMGRHIRMRDTPGV
ncbi:hypothetical protein ZEAMMB73_Zm00001d050950 [Zea mays]|uniref:Uncharacterized protein n=1 Tax=Zea mays TaxID=4577 RepID=A0A1D6Q418_MAIZE|nr:hypothetical protein ZEAMMB73_Zm00001d050950 [Zea mays]